MDIACKNHDRRDFLRKSVLGSAGLLLGGAYGARAAAKPVGDAEKVCESIGVIPREDWTNISPRLDRMHAAHGFHRVTVHHSGNSESETIRNAVIYELEGILAGHLDRRYGDIGYHLVIDRAGRVWGGRSLAYKGAHVRSENGGNIGIMLLGNFEEQEPSQPQVKALKSSLLHLSLAYNVAENHIFGHCDIGASACPGRNLYVHLDRMRRVAS